MTTDPREEEPLDLRLAKAVHEAIVRTVGPGYHPDTPAAEYTTSPGVHYDMISTTALDTLRAHGVDPAAHALDVLAATWRVNALVHLNLWATVAAEDEAGAQEAGRRRFEALHPDAALVDVVDWERLG